MWPKTMLMALVMAVVTSVFIYCIKLNNYGFSGVDKLPPPVGNLPLSVSQTPRAVSGSPRLESCRQVKAFYSDSEMKEAGFNPSLAKASLCLPQPRYLPLPPDNQHDCSLPYVTINSAGRLGNKITEYLSLSVIRKVFGVRVAIAQGMSDTLVAIFPKLSLPVATGECYPRVTHSESFAKLYMKLFAKSADSRALDDTQLYPYPLQQSVYVKDFPCPSHILITMRDHFRQEFTFNQRVLRKAKVQVAAALQALNTALRDATIVTVHVRRTDYLAHVKNYYKQSPVKDVYYQRAFNFFRNRTHNPVFVVTSDDPEWCKNNFKDKDIVYAGGRDPVVDLAVLALGDHHIITDGTFGFSGAFLGKGIIVYPEPTGWPVYPCFKTPLLHPISRT
ncbi:galactoside alpha-(1,2)-fucosyltransferase 1-like [Procambarus clarkii]|uniref:galactoside alpha-(1,2)-fucosyltransferase 1-like n=1 Tax=Procambarus clarkii TaxID=6728 RepID=UPI003743D41F